MKMVIDFDELTKIQRDNRKQEEGRLTDEELFCSVGEAVIRSWEHLCGFNRCNEEINISQKITNAVLNDIAIKETNHEH